MTSALTLADQLGRSNIAALVGVGNATVSNAIKKGVFPAHWFVALRRACDEQGLDCPQNLFSFTNAETHPSVSGSERRRSGLSLLSAQRINDAISNSPYTKKDINERLGLNPSWLANITSANKLKDENAHRPMPGADVMARLAAELGVEANYLLGYAPAPRSIVAEYPAEVAGLIDRFANDLMRAATAKCAGQGTEIGPQDVLKWWRDTGGEVGRGADIEEYFDVVRIPDANDHYVTPIKVGAKSLSAKKIGSSDTNRLLRQVRSWPRSTQRDLVRVYREIRALDCGSSFPVTDMTVKMEGDPEPYRYWSLRLKASLGGSDSTPVAICFAFE
ncbi:MAG: helix-turn-helix transcriptional regulator [Pseudomonadota bacterium]